MELKEAIELLTKAYSRADWYIRAQPGLEGHMPVIHLFHTKDMPGRIKTKRKTVDDFKVIFIEASP